MGKSGNRKRPTIDDLRPASALVRDRVKEIRRVRADQIRANPKNWRQHPRKQSLLVERIIGKIGFADVMIAYEDEEYGLTLIDGHLRQEVMERLDPQAEVPVLVLDLSREEADTMLAMLDATTGMAKTDAEKYETLLQELKGVISGISHDALDLLRSVGKIPAQCMNDLSDLSEEKVDAELLKAMSRMSIEDHLQDTMVMFRVPELIAARHHDFCGDIGGEHGDAPVIDAGSVTEDEVWLLFFYLAWVRKIKGEQKKRTGKTISIPLAVTAQSWGRFREIYLDAVKHGHGDDLGHVLLEGYGKARG